MNDLKRRWSVRPKLLVVGALAVGTAMVFPAAFTAILGSIALSIAMLGLLAWTGALGLASMAAVAVLPLALTILILVAIAGGVRGTARLAAHAFATGKTRLPIDEADDDASEEPQ